MGSKELLAAGLLLTAALLARSAETITARNWSRHPAIVEVKAIYEQVRRAEAAGTPAPATTPVPRLLP
jgi:hypothetical protein